MHARTARAKIERRRALTHFDNGSALSCAGKAKQQFHPSPTVCASAMWSQRRPRNRHSPHQPQHAHASDQRPHTSHVPDHHDGRSRPVPTLGVDPHAPAHAAPQCGHLPAFRHQSSLSQHTAHPEGGLAGPAPPPPLTPIQRRTALPRRGVIAQNRSGRATAGAGHAGTVHTFSDDLLRLRCGTFG
jgi:hypothetical protein